MHQAPKHGAAGQPRQVRAGLAPLVPFAGHLADKEPAADKRSQVDVARHEVAPAETAAEVEPVLPSQPLKRLTLDQRHGAGAMTVAIQAGAGRDHGIDAGGSTTVLLDEVDCLDVTHRP